MSEPSGSSLRSLSETEFAEQERERGRRIHHNDGVAWATVAGSYSRPVFEFRRIRPGEARPARHLSLLGYSHQVPDPEMGTRSVGFMTMECDALRSFGISALRSEKRAQVRKGLRECEVREIVDLSAEIDAIRAVAISQAARQMQTGQFDRPPSYYTEQEAAWRLSVQRCFGRTGWRWLGAYVDGRLAAYLTLLAVEDHAIFMAVKSHTDSFRHCPSDALYFRALEELRDARWCRRVVNGGVAHESLNRFKGQFGFAPVSVAYYSPNAGVVGVAKRAWGLADAARRWFTRLSRPVTRELRSQGPAAAGRPEGPSTTGGARPA